MAVVSGAVFGGVYCYIEAEVVMNLADFHFIRPYWLLAIIPAIAVLALMLRNRRSHGNWSAVCDSALLPYLLQEQSRAVKKSFFTPLTAGLMAALLVIIALAGPTWERLPAPVFRNESALVIALDLSRSMDAADIKPSRLTLARYKIADILKQRKDGQTALLVYAGDAFVVTPLTNDTETIDSQLSALTTEIMPSQGSNTMLALEKAAELFKQGGLQKGQIVLVTDGVTLNQAAGYAADIAADNYSVSILGVGTVDGAPIPAPDGGFLKDEQGAIVIPKLDTGDLLKLAQAGNGIYQTITANDADIQALLSGVDKPVTQQGVEESKLLLEQWEDKGPWLLLLALPLAALMFRKGLLCFALLVLLPLPKNSYAFAWEDLWRTKDQQAQQAYQQQQYDKAAEQFDNQDWKAAAHYKAGDYEKALESLNTSETALSAYNQGNALAQSGKLEDAIKAYEKALAINPGDADAKYNKELVEKELEKQKQQEQEEQKQKQQQQQQDDKEQSGDKSPQDQDKQGEKSGQSDNEQKPDQKPERSGEEQASEQQQKDGQDAAENKEQQNQPEQKEPASENAQAKQNKEQADEKPEQQSQESAAKAQLSDEQKQANEQWLKRIPDDPSGLLKRKFKYQYGQRGRQESGKRDAW
ncbi:MAG: VWA domain-containing protein [Methylococcaceae bacterium]